MLHFKRRSSVRKVFLKISKNSQENTCARVNIIKKETRAQVFSHEFCEISKNNFFYRTSDISRSLFRTPLNIFGAFLQKQLLSRKSCIIDVGPGF